MRRQRPALRGGSVRIHVVPWCLDCGLIEHHSDFFDENGDRLESGWDSDAFDIEVMAGRLGAKEYDRENLAAELGIKPTTVWQYVNRGKLPHPHHYDTVDRRHGNRRAVWTAEQVAEILLARGA